MASERVKGKRSPLDKAFVDRSQRLQGSHRQPEVAGRDLRLADIDANERTVELLGDILAHVAHARDGGARAALDDDEPAPGQARAPAVEALLLLPRPALVPLRIPEHQDIRPGEGAADWTHWQRGDRAHGRLIDRDGRRLCRVNVPESAVTCSSCTLHPLDRSMHLDDLILGEASPLKVTVDVGGVDEAAARHAFGPAAQDAEAFVRRGLAVEVQTVAVEAPTQFGIVLE